jgi:hypothetical protein
MARMKTEMQFAYSRMRQSADDVEDARAQNQVLPEWLR